MMTLVHNVAEARRQLMAHELIKYFPKHAKSKFSIFDRRDDLWIGITFASFHKTEKIPALSELLKTVMRTSKSVGLLFIEARRNAVKLATLARIEIPQSL